MSKYDLSVLKRTKTYRDITIGKHWFFFYFLGIMLINVFLDLTDFRFRGKVHIYI